MDSVLFSYHNNNTWEWCHMQLETFLQQLVQKQEKLITTEMWHSISYSKMQICKNENFILKTSLWYIIEVINKNGLSTYLGLFEQQLSLVDECCRKCMSFALKDSPCFLLFENMFYDPLHIENWLFQWSLHMSILFCRQRQPESLYHSGTARHKVNRNG